ncbi:MAG TPA: TIGR03086 family metal-binding protein [Microthrixaceae bacterium]|nr:TIGR03086 family metal-binding protein [Microthrixaceae bacterium]
MEITQLIDDGFAWTAARVAAVTPDQLDLPTPCSLWDLEELLDHTIESMTMLTEAIEAETLGESDVSPMGSRRWDVAVAALAERNRRAWASRGVMDRTIELPFGSVPAPNAASVTLLEVVVHGWDIGQASGEAPDIPESLAVPVLDFAPAVDANRGENFAADLGIGDTPSDRVVAFLGRKPLWGRAR